MLVDPAHTTTEAWTHDGRLRPGHGTRYGEHWKSRDELEKCLDCCDNNHIDLVADKRESRHGTGENVTVNITVKPTTGTATGDVSLIAKFSRRDNTGSRSVHANQWRSHAGLKTQSLPGGILQRDRSLRG